MREGGDDEVGGDGARVGKGSRGGIGMGGAGEGGMMQRGERGKWERERGAYVHAGREEASRIRCTKWTIGKIPGCTIATRRTYFTRRDEEMGTATYDVFVWPSQGFRMPFSFLILSRPFNAKVSPSCHAMPVINTK